MGHLLSKKKKMKPNTVVWYYIVTGTTLNYFLDDRINKAEILFPGVGCFLVAICLGSAVHSSNSADNAAKLEGISYDHGKEAGWFFILSIKWNI